MAPVALAHGAVALDPLSAGAMLRNAREKTGLHIAALAVALKVPVSKLEALEADRLDLLPDAVFARALASTICRTLKLDPGPVLRRLPDQRAPRLQRDARSVVRTPFDTPGMGWRLPLLSRLSRPTAITAAILLLAALVLLIVPALEFPSAKLPSTPARAMVAAGTSVAPAAAPATPVAAVAPVTASAPSAAPVPVAIATAAVDVAARSPAANPANQNVGTEPPGSSLVSFKARGPTWVEVTDASGVVQLRKTLGAGEMVSASGTPPLSVVVGRVDSTDVLVRGKAFELAPVSKDNVARFQIR